MTRELPANKISVMTDRRRIKHSSQTSTAGVSSELSTVCDLGVRPVSCQVTACTHCLVASGGLVLSQVLSSVGCGRRLATTPLSATTYPSLAPTVSPRGLTCLSGLSLSDHAFLCIAFYFSEN